METGRISSWQLFHLILSLVIGLMLVRVPPSLTQLAGPDSWISMLLALGVDVVLAGALYALGRRFPGQTLFQYAPMILGRVPGKMVASAYVWLFIHAAAISIYIFAAGYKLVLPETPLLVFVLLVVAVSTTGAYYGLETMARASEIVSPMSVVISVLILILTLKDMDLGNLRPVLGNGIKGPAAGALVAASWYGICVVMGLFMAYHDKPQQAFVAKTAGVAVGMMLVTLLTLGSIAALGPLQAANQRVPTWSLTRIILIAGFFERLQMLFVSLLMTTGFVTLGVLHHASSLGVAQLFGLKEYRPLVLPMGLVLAGLAYGVVGSHLDLQPFFRDAFPSYALLIEGGLTFLLLAVAWVRGVRNSGKQIDEGSGDGGKLGV